MHASGWTVPIGGATICDEPVSWGRPAASRPSSPHIDQQLHDRHFGRLLLTATLSAHGVLSIAVFAAHVVDDLGIEVEPRFVDRLDTVRHVISGSLAFVSLLRT